MKNISKKFPAVSQQQNIEFGIVLILILCIASYVLKNDLFIAFAIILCLIDLAIPALFTPFSAIWYKLSEVLGVVCSVFILTVIYYLVVTPVGILRRVGNKDSLSIKQFRKSRESVLIDRNHQFSSEDLTKSF